MVVWSDWYGVGKLYIWVRRLVDTPYNKATGPQEGKKKKRKKTARCETISQINFAFLRFLFVITIIISLKNADVLRR